MKCCNEVEDSNFSIKKFECKQGVTICYSAFAMKYFFL